ncbi:MAG: MerR family transcriptional regulator [Gemmatimonadota bacterium]|jgi:DNA-binding transcriptional MerR regulator
MTDGRTGEAAGLRTVGEVAALAHVTVRTLHHYDAIGLLRPTDRSGAGYRLYDDGDLARLHQVLLFRELGLPLDTIRGLLDAPAADRRRVLLEQRTALEARRRRTDAVIRAVDRAIDALETGDTMSETTMFEGFDAFDHAEYADEAEERWGGTDAYRESARRTKSYGKAEWSAIKAEADDLMERFAALMATGAGATGPEARALAEEHRRHIDRWFYPCPPRMHAGLADMYQADARFAGSFEKHGAGMAAFVSDAIRANAAADPE